MVLRGWIGICRSCYLNQSRAKIALDRSRLLGLPSKSLDTAVPVCSWKIGVWQGKRISHHS